MYSEAMNECGELEVAEMLGPNSSTLMLLLKILPCKLHVTQSLNLAPSPRIWHQTTRAAGGTWFVRETLERRFGSQFLEAKNCTPLRPACFEGVLPQEVAGQIELKV